MQDKYTKTISFLVNSVRKAFSSEQLTSYSGLSVITDLSNTAVFMGSFINCLQLCDTVQAVLARRKYYPVFC